MPTKTWRGDSLAVAQVNHITIAGTWADTETVTVQIDDTTGNPIRAFTLTVDNAGGRTIEEVVDAIISAWNLGTADASFTLDKNVSGSPELSEITASKSGTTIVVLTSDTAGTPFVQTSAETAAAGTALTSTPTASTGPNHWDDDKNWSPVNIPVDTDSVYIQDSDVDILYGLDQNTVGLTLLQIDASFIGTIGLPRTNTNATAYVEYRETYLKIESADVRVGDGLGTGSGRLKLEIGTAVSTITVLATGNPLEQDLKPLILKGMFAGSILTAQGGSIDVGPFGGETGVVATLNASGSADIRIGDGITLTTPNVSGTARVEINVAMTTLTMQDSPTVLVQGSGTLATANVFGGTLDYRSTGTITTLLLGAAGILDTSNNPTGATVTNVVTAASGSSIQDPNKMMTFTAGILYQNCALSEVTANYGRGFTITLS